MDDIYFTDKKGRRNGKDKKASGERFTQSEYNDINSNPSLKKRTREQGSVPAKKNFRVNLPDEDYTTHPAPSRTPQGRRRTDIPAPPATRAPASRQRSAPVYYEQEEYEPPRSREPKKPPVGPKRKKKRHIGAKLFVGFFLIAVALIIGAFGYGYSILGEINYNSSITDNAYVDESTLASDPSVRNILIIGSDARDYDGTEGQRSDSMILFSIDKNNKQIKLTSFLRDSYVYIPSEEYSDKLNSSYSYGGAQLTMDTLEYNFGVKIDNYVIVDFKIFTGLIDLLGGITVDGVTENEVYYMTETLSFPNIVEGSNKLSGYQALWYCRMRMLDDDFHRTERQRKVIKSVIKQAASTNIFDLVEIVKKVVPYIETDIPQNDLLSLGVGAALSFIRYDIVQQQIPADGSWSYDDIDGASVIVLNLEQNQAVLKNFVYNKFDESVTTTLPDIGEYYRGEYYDDYYDDDYYYDDSPRGRH